MIEEDKASLTYKRVKLIEALTTPLSPEDRVHAQGELSVLNAKIKALNMTEAARLKAAATIRRSAGVAEAQANAARARARAQGGPSPERPETPAPGVPGEEDETLEPFAPIDSWIDAVLLRHDIDFTRAHDGKLTIHLPPKWAAIFDTFIDGLYAATQGRELPMLPRDAPKAKKAPKTPKPKKR